MGRQVQRKLSSAWTTQKLFIRCKASLARPKKREQPKEARNDEKLKVKTKKSPRGYRTCQDFLDWQTALRKGSSEWMPRADATTANARAVTLRTLRWNTAGDV